MSKKNKNLETIEILLNSFSCDNIYSAYEKNVVDREEILYFKTKLIEYTGVLEEAITKSEYNIPRSGEKVAYENHLISDHILGISEKEIEELNIIAKIAGFKTDLICKNNNTEKYYFKKDPNVYVAALSNHIYKATQILIR